MKLMIVGSDKVYSIENYYVKYIREAGVDVKAFNAQGIFHDFYQQNILRKIFFKVGISGIYQKINSLFKIEVNLFQPNVIWVFKGMEIFPETLEWVKKKDILLVNYNPDNPFIFTGKGSGNKNITKSISLFHLHFTYNLQIQKQLQEKYNIRTVYLPFGYDLDEKLFCECLTLQEKNKACFVGNPDKQRAKFIMALAEKGIKLDLYGTKWKNFVQHENLNCYSPVLGDEFWKVLRSYRVQLNLMRIHNEDSHNMRTFEVPGIGGIMVAPETIEHKLFFEDGREVFLFKNVDECVKRIQYLLQMNEVESDVIRANARKRSIKEGYTYKDRAMYALREIQSFHV